MVHIGFFLQLLSLSFMSFLLASSISEVNRALSGLASSCAWTRSVICTCTCVGRIWTCDVLLLKFLFINITVSNVPKNGSGRKRFRERV